MRRILTATLIALLCSQVFVVPAASTSKRRYSPVYAREFKPAEKYRRGSLQGDFVWAAGSTNLRTAAARWKSFLHTHGEKELDSAIEARLISIAKFELMRVYYLLGDVAAGDKLMRELDPLKLLDNGKS